jgi:hypothetical protein
MATPLTEITSRNRALLPMSAWSPQQQTARMLALCEAQMEAATQDSDAAVDVLVKTFTDLMSAVRGLDAVSRASETDAPTTETLAEIQERCNAPSPAAAAIMAFQFYDKLSQRWGMTLQPVHHGLFICDRSNRSVRNIGKTITDAGASIRTAEECATFDSIAGSLSLTISEQEEPLAKAMSDAGSIELFPVG